MAKSKAVQTRLDINNFTNLIRVAEKKGLSVSMMVRLILIDYLEGKINV